MQQFHHDWDEVGPLDRGDALHVFLMFPDHRPRRHEVRLAAPIDLGGGATTSEFTDAVIDKVRTKVDVWSSLGTR